MVGRYYLAQINMNESDNPMFVIYDENFKQIVNLIKEEPMFDFKEKEISEEQFGELEKISNKCFEK